MNPVKAIDSAIITFTKANFHNVCRVCFCDNKPDLFNIFSEESIVELINICMPKQAIDISLPNNICEDCLIHLNQFKAFINQFQYADTVLTFVKDQLNNGSKEVKINNWSRPNVRACLEDFNKKLGASDSPSTSVFEQNKAIGNTNKKALIIRKGKSTANTFSNLNKTKSKSTEHISVHQTTKNPLRLPLVITCIICKVPFLNYTVFKMHMRNCHSSKPLKCNSCVPIKEFFDAEELKRHKITSHNLIECGQCSSFVGPANIDKHNEKLHPPNAFADNEENQCKLHIIKIENMNPSSTKCYKCSSNFANDELYAEHLVLCKQSIGGEERVTTGPPAIVNSTKPIVKNQRMICILCQDKQFPSYTHFEQHCSKQHEDLTCCNICRTNNLYSKEAFKLHKINTHGFVTCHICQATVKLERIHKHVEDSHNTKNLPVKTWKFFLGKK